MRVEMTKVYPFRTSVATLTDRERGWESDDAIFLGLIKIREKMIQPELLRRDFGVSRFPTYIKLLAEAMKAEITHLDLGYDPDRSKQTAPE